MLDVNLMWQCSNHMHNPPLPRPDPQEQICPTLKRVPKKGLYRIRLIPWAKLCKFMLREGTWRGVQRKQIRADFSFLLSNC